MRNYQRISPRHPFGPALRAAWAVSRPTTRDIAWAAGFYEGEGTCSYATRSQHVVVNQVEREPLEKMQRFFGGTIVSIGAYRKSQPSFRWSIHGPRACGFLMTIYGFLSVKRKHQVRKALRYVEANR